MRILFLSPYLPYPVRHGGHKRAWGMIRCLSRFASVHVLAIGEPGGEGLAAGREALASLGATIEVHAATGPGRDEADAENESRLPDAAAHFRSPGLESALARALVERPANAVHFEELVMAQYAGGMSAPRILDRQKVEWTYHEALAASGGRDGVRHRREAARFRGWESALAGRFAAVLVMGEGDRRALDPVWGAGRLHVVPNGVDNALTLPADRTADVRHVLLYGTLDYPPNAEANAAYFRDVWPRLRERMPDLRTLVVGSGPAPSSLSSGDPRVEVRGFVEDIGAVLRGPGVLVVPLRVGGGLRNKILEAMACGMPVVSTAVGAENLGLEPGRHYLRAETPLEMAEAVARLAGDSHLVRSLSRAGAAHVDASFRWDGVARLVEPIYREASRGGGARPTRPRALLVGVRPLPREAQARALSFPGHRTEQFSEALARAGCEVEGVLLDEEGDGAAPAWTGGRAHVLSPRAFRAAEELQRVHDAFEPDVVVAAGGYHPARVVSQLRTDRPRWIDLPGDLAAEGQLREARSGNGALDDYLAVLRQALAVGDRFSVVGPSQRLALLGQLGLSGRLTGGTLEGEPVAIVPLASEGPPSPAPLPAGPLRVLWSGGYNTWMDEETLFEGVEEAMALTSDLVFVSTGGPVPGHEETVHDAFWSRTRASRFASRFEDHGRLPRREALSVLDGCHAVVSIARPSLEAELGSRQRAVEAMAHGRPAIVTEVGDLAQAVGDRKAGLLVPPRQPAALASALARLAGDRDLLVSLAHGARALWQARWTPARVTAPLVAWASRPTRWPAPAPQPGHGVAPDARLLRLQAELDAIRGSYTFRALRLLDRLLGRAGR